MEVQSEEEAREKDETLVVVGVEELFPSCMGGIYHIHVCTYIYTCAENKFVSKVHMSHSGRYGLGTSS